MAIIDGLNKIFESKIRLGIMSVLVANGSSDFATLKSLLELTDGNLASHARSLEEAGYLRCEKKFVARKNSWAANPTPPTSSLSRAEKPSPPTSTRWNAS